MAWWQLNAQFTDKLKGHWFWSSPEWMAIFGIPIGYLFFHSTRLSYEHFGFTWNILDWIVTGKPMSFKFIGELSI